jgi:hypothetical protein
LYVVVRSAGAAAVFFRGYCLPATVWRLLSATDAAKYVCAEASDVAVANNFIAPCHFLFLVFLRV